MRSEGFFGLSLRNGRFVLGFARRLVPPAPVHYLWGGRCSGSEAGLFANINGGGNFPAISEPWLGVALGAFHGMATGGLGGVCLWMA